MSNVRLVAKRNGGYGREFTTEIAIPPARVVTIGWEDLENQYDIQEGRCWWLGHLLDMEAVFRTRYVLTPSVDRLDNSRGYEPGNFVLTTRFANLARGDTPADEFRKILATIFQNQLVTV